MTKAIFFDIFGTLVDWRTSLVKKIKKSKIFNEDVSFEESLVINWRLEYQPILNKVNKKIIPWMILDDLHLISLNNVLRKMKVEYLNENQKRKLVLLWHKLDPWKDTVKGLKLLNNNYITCSLSNGNISLQKKLFKYAKLDFNFLFSAENFKKYKPDLSVYHGAANNLSLAPRECVLVASHKNDLKAANKAGYKTVFLERKNEYGKYVDKFQEKPFEANIHINSLENLKEKLSRI